MEAKKWEDEGKFHAIFLSASFIKASLFQVGHKTGPLSPFLKHPEVAEAAERIRKLSCHQSGQSKTNKILSSRTGVCKAGYCPSWAVNLFMFTPDYDIFYLLVIFLNLRLFFFFIH